jgi:hypothetical protein
MIFHADMVASPLFLENSLKHLKEKTVVSLTRIEPPLHPPGVEKIIQDFGVYPEQFEFEKFHDFCSKEIMNNKDKTTNGIFAPWLMYKKDFLEIGGHDWLFSPCGLEDSDIFNRMLLNEFNLIQSRDALVYHFTARGERFTEELGKDSFEYSDNMRQKQKEWLRKWHQPVLHDQLMMPIIKPVFNIGFSPHNFNLHFLPLDILHIVPE